MHMKEDGHREDGDLAAGAQRTREETPSRITRRDFLNGVLIGSGGKAG